MTRAFLILIGLWSAVAVGPAVSAGSAPPVSPGMTAAECRADRDRALARLDQERRTIRAMFDADRAALDAADYTLQKAEQAILDQLVADRADAEARYARCRAAARR